MVTATGRGLAAIGHGLFLSGYFFETFAILAGADPLTINNFIVPDLRQSAS